MRLVEALSAFPELQTLESCEGDESQGAWVSFWYGSYWDHSWHDLSEFVLGYLGPRLAREVGDSAELAIRVTESGVPQGELSIRPGAAPVVINALRNLARSSGRNLARSSGYSGDKSGTSP